MPLDAMSTSAQPQAMFAAPEAITLRNDRFATAPRGLPRVSCVLPCHNEQDNLELLLPLLRDMLTENSRAWEVILVDDGSTDGTAALMARWSQLPRFKIIQLSRNFGKEAALTAGLQAAHGDVVVT